MFPFFYLPLSDMKNAFKLFEYKGIPVYLKYWALLLFLFLDISTTIIVIVSVLIHEMAHARVAKNLGYTVEYVYMSVIHGAAKIDRFEKANDHDTKSISFAGPKANLILGLLILPILFISVIVYLEFGFDSTEISEQLLFTVLLETSIINLLLGVFNLLPIYPLDGGRIFKSTLNMKVEKSKSKLISGVVSGTLSMGLMAVSIFISDYIMGALSLIHI